MAGFPTFEIKVLAYNVWGMPRQFGGKQKSLRFPKLAKMLREGCQRKEYDVVLLSELWMKHDHETIKQEMVKFKVEKNLNQESQSDGVRSLHNGMGSVQLFRLAWGILRTRYCVTVNS